MYGESTAISCSFNFHYDELNLKSTQGDKVSHDEEDDVVIIKHFAYNLGNLFSDVNPSYKVTSKNYHLIHNIPVEIIDDSHLHTNVELTMLSKFNHPIFESSRTCQGVEALQLQLLVMLGFDNHDEVSKLG